MALFGVGGVVAAGGYVWGKRVGLNATSHVATAVAVLAGVLATVGLPLTQAPVVGDYAVAGGRVLHELWLAYAVAAAGLWALGLLFYGDRRDRALVQTLQGMAWCVVVVGVVAGVRRAFHGTAAWPGLPGGADVSLAEMAAWVAAVVALSPLGLGLARFFPRVDSARTLVAGAAWVAAAGAGLGVWGLGIAKNPLLVAEPVGGLPVLNLLPFIYGVPVLLLVVAARRTVGRTPRGDGDGLVVFLRTVAAALGALGVALIIRHVFHAPDLRLSFAFAAAGRAVPAESLVGFREFGTYALVLLAISAVGAALRLPWTRGVPVAAVAGAALAVMGAGGFANPLRFAETVGSWPVLNAVLWVLGGPALLAAAVARLLKVTHPRVAAGLSGAAIVLTFGAVTLLVRQAFVGTDLTLAAHAFTGAEWYAYSVAWLVLGGALLAGGVVTGRTSMRYGSLAVLLLAVGKVFLLDTRHLDGLLRAGSFFGLGLTLMGLGYVYQRFVMTKKEDA